MSADNHNKFAIHEAIKENNTQLAKSLIDANPSQLYVKDEDDRIPLHWACTINNEALVNHILEKDPKKNVDLDEFVDLSGWTPLHITSSIGNLNIFNAIYHHYSDLDLNIKTNTGTTYLDLAISKKYIELVKELIELKVNCRNKDKRGVTPIIRAASIGSKSVIQLLVDKGKININAKDNDGWTCLHHALSEGFGDIAIYLVKLGADPTIKNTSGELPIAVAVDDKVKQFFVSNLKKDEEGS
ncbi:unnamed protein product [Candida verbasci]|uniref:Uncharacterized protein n=1 Tax=Candida verbasci TaxID=1227364 RepID=A0A9W4TW91_9ASCO|nr:unnamed protein product [Candida verbasci]